MADQQVIMALSTFNTAYKNNQTRAEQIRINRIKMKELKPSVEEFNRLEKETKELKSENDKDRKFVSDTISFYENQTDDTVAVGDLFENNDSGQTENDKN